MTARILSATLGTVLLIAPLAFAQNTKPSPTRPAKSSENTADRQSNMSSDMQEAIAWERRKDAAAARQARMEAQHPTVTYNGANRSMDDPEGKVKDPQAGGAKKDK